MLIIQISFVLGVHEDDGPQQLAPLECLVPHVLSVYLNFSLFRHSAPLYQGEFAKFQHVLFSLHILAVSWISKQYNIFVYCVTAEKCKSTFYKLPYLYWSTNLSQVNMYVLSFR